MCFGDDIVSDAISDVITDSIADDLVSLCCMCCEGDAPPVQEQVS